MTLKFSDRLIDLLQIYKTQNSTKNTLEIWVMTSFIYTYIYLNKSGLWVTRWQSCLSFNWFRTRPPSIWAQVRLHVGTPPYTHTHTHTHTPPAAGSTITAEGAGTSLEGQRSRVQQYPQIERFILFYLHYCVYACVCVCVRA